MRPRWNFWVSFFKKVHQKGLFGVEKENSNFRFLTADSRKLQTVALKSVIVLFGVATNFSLRAFSCNCYLQSSKSKDPSEFKKRL